MSVRTAISSSSCTGPGSRSPGRRCCSPFIPFSLGFAEVADYGRGLYYLALTSAAVASVFFIASVAQHRILRQGLKEPLVHRASLYSLIGTLALAVAMTSATLMVVGYLLDGPLPLLTATAALAAWLWFIQPVLQCSMNS